MGVPVEFEPTETWLLEEELAELLAAIRFETDHVDVSEAGGEALLESTRTSGTHAHLAVLHRRDCIDGTSTTDGSDAGNEPLEDGIRASFQHDSSPRTYSVQCALEPYRRRTLEH